MTASDSLHLAFGALAGVTLIAMFLFAWDSMKARGAKHAIGSLAACLLALVLLLGAAAQLDPVLRGLKPVATAPDSAKSSAPKPAANASASAVTSKNGKAEPVAPKAKAGQAPAVAKPESAFPLPKLDLKAVLPALLKFASSLAFLAALVGGIAAALLAWVTRDDPSEEEAPRADPLVATEAAV